MAEQVVRRTGQQPENYLMDGGFVDLEDIQTLEDRGIAVYAPPRETETAVVPKSRGEEVWRTRMETEEAKEIYKHPPQAGRRMGECPGTGATWVTEDYGERPFQGAVRLRRVASGAGT